MQPPVTVQQSSMNNKVHSSDYYLILHYFTKIRLCAIDSYRSSWFFVSCSTEFHHQWV